MKIPVARATGKTGSRLINELRSRGHSLIAPVRESSDTSSLGSDVTLREGDLTDLDENACDAVIFAAGAGGGSSEEMTDKVDGDGAIRLIDLASRASVAHFVMLSTVGADEPDSNSNLANYLQAKHDADEYLKFSSLDYAIVRPVALTDEDGVRDIRFGDEVDLSAKAARGDVAAVLAVAVDDANWQCKALLMQSA